MLIRCRRLIKLVILGILVVHMSYYNLYVGCADNKQSSEVKLIGKNINSKSSTQNITYTSSGKVHTYTPKEGHAFNDVYEKKSGGGCWCCKSEGYELDIWKADASTKEYAFKVVYEENNNTVTIHLPNKTKKYKKINDNWTEEGSSSAKPAAGAAASDGTQPTGTPTNPAAAPAATGTPPSYN